ncbi:MAG: VOC family protein [Actinobacteria bacterium]|nr:VOC family protein [Actinomycetota bacterium]
MPIRDAYEPGRPCWVDLATSDPAAARSFYGEMFGWGADVDSRPEAGGYAQFVNDGNVVAGVGPIFAEGMPPSWTTYISTADADGTTAVLTANGGTVLQPPLDVFDSGRMAVFSGPDGAVAGLWQPQQHVGATFVNEPGGWSWSQLITRDKEAALAFYGAVFDWRLREHPDWGEHLALGEDGGEIAGATQMGDEFPPEVPSHWQVGFLVHDADAFLSKAEGLGATPHGPVQDMVMGGRVGSLADPQGASFGVMSFATPFS